MGKQKLLEIARLVFLALLLPLIACELAARVYFASQPPTNYIAMDAISPEALREQVARTTTWDDRGFWVSPRDTLPHVTAPHTIYMLGSSVMQGQFLTDSETIPSVLQQHLQAYRVVNMSANGHLSSNVYRLIRTLSLHRGDIVVMDAQDALSAFDIQNNRRAQCAPLAITQFVCQPRPYDELNTAIADDTAFNVERARAYVQAHDATFLYVVMPYFYSHEPQTEREHKIDGPPALTAVYRSAWSAIYARMQGEPDVLDLSGLLADGRDHWFDLWHFDAKGSELVARAIYKRLFGPF